MKPKFKNLSEYLLSQKEQSFSLSFEQLEKIIEAPISPVYLKHKSIERPLQSMFQKHSTAVGFFIDNVNYDSKIVHFIFGASVIGKKGRKNKNNEPKNLSQTLVVKNFSGSFNDNGVGHEIINLFTSNKEAITGKTVFYVPPYGSVCKEKIAFLNESQYKAFKKIVVFDSTSITNVLKLKSVILEPEPIQSKEEMYKIAESLKFGSKNIPLTKINFYDDEFQSKNEDRKKVQLFPFTYIVDKTKYYDLENKNIFILHARTKNDKNDDSLAKFHIVFGKKTKIKELKKTRIGEKNYAFNLGDDFDLWFDEVVKPLLTSKNQMQLMKIPKKIHVEYAYDRNNFLEYVKKYNDENLYTNFICSIINDNTKLKNNFFSDLVNKYFDVKNYKPSNVFIESQYQSLISEKKEINKYLKAKSENDVDTLNDAKRRLIEDYGYTETRLKNLKRCADGIMDIYMHDDNYRIVIENKILSGINGKQKDIDSDITQLQTYRTFLDDLNKQGIEKQKKNKVILLAPQKSAFNFVNYDKNVPVMTYRNLAEFFTKHKDLIVKKYRHDFLNAIYKHSHTKEEDITVRFFNSLK